MKISVSYVAEDGKVFSTAEECVNYEENKRVNSTAVARFFSVSSGGYLNEIPVSQDDTSDGIDYILVLNGGRFVKWVEESEKFCLDIECVLTTFNYHDPVILVKNEKGWFRAEKLLKKLHEKVNAMEKHIAEIQNLT